MKCGYCKKEMGAIGLTRKKGIIMEFDGCFCPFCKKKFKGVLS